MAQLTACPPLPASGFVSVVDAMRAVDCRSGAAVEVAFSRLFGDHGLLGQALTLLLTLYVALFALNLLTGRSRLTLNMLTPRMLQLGLVLTFATSWVAYQQVVWTLLVEAPDQIASLLLGTKGSAAHIFAARLDGLFDALARAAQQAQAANATAPVPGSLTPQLAGAPARPSDLLWLASLLLLLGTVGVLIVARIALAALLALGPVFIVLALFPATRALFEGWLRAALVLAITPVLAVLLGSATLVMIAPMITALDQSSGPVPIGLASSIFLAAFVYLALMVLATRGAREIAGAWRLNSGPSPAESTHSQATTAALLAAGLRADPANAAPGVADSDHLRGIIQAAAGRTAILAGPAGLSVTAGSGPRAGPAAGESAGPQRPTPGRDPRIRPLAGAARNQISKTQASHIQASHIQATHIQGGRQA